MFQTRFGGDFSRLPKGLSTELNFEFVRFSRVWLPVTPRSPSHFSSKFCYILPLLSKLLQSILCLRQDSSQWWPQTVEGVSVNGGHEATS